MWSIVPIFRGPFLEKVAKGVHVPVFLELAQHHSEFGPPCPSEPLYAWFEFFYRLLFERYRCEYVYKNVIATRLFLAHHSLNEAFMTDEIRSGSSRADVAILNGTSSVYEIKSEFDSFDRLDAQLLDYRKIFDRINIVTTEDQAFQALTVASPNIGVIAMLSDGSLKTLRPAVSNKHNIDPGTVFDCMRRSEFCGAVSEAFGSMPNLPNSQLYRAAREMFCSLPPDIAHDLMVRQIRRRGKTMPFAALIEQAPSSLKHACLNFNKSISMADHLAKRLNLPLHEEIFSVSTR